MDVGNLISGSSAFSKSSLNIWKFSVHKNGMKRQKDMTLKDELPRSVGTQYATGEERIDTRKNEETKQKQCPVVDVTGEGSKV